MTKHSVETDLDELSKGILGDLDHKDRHGLVLKAIEEGSEQQRKRLDRTAQRGEYHGRDPEYTRWVHLLSKLAVGVVSNLNSLVLEHQLAQNRRTYQDLLDLYTPDNEEIPLSGMMEADGEHREKLLRDLYLSYHISKRFSEQIVGVDLETWVASTPRGIEVVEMAEKMLELYSELVEQIDEEIIEPPNDIDRSREGMPDELPEKPIDQLVLSQYVKLIDDLEEELERDEIPIGSIGFGS